MKILQYTLGLPPYRRGGLPRYSTDLSEELANMGEDVTLVYPGQMSLTNSTKLRFKYKNTKYPFKVCEMINPLPVSLGLGIDKAAPYFEKRNKENIEKFLYNIKPDIIHIHTFMGLPIEFLEVAHKNKIKIVFTTHDFYGLCPKMLKPNTKNLLKSYNCTYDCMLCQDGPSLKKIKIMQSHLYEKLKNTQVFKKVRQTQKNNILESLKGIKIPKEEVLDRYKLRQYYLKMFNLIDIFHFNSTVAADYIKHFLPTASGKVINITHKGLKDNRVATPKFTGNFVKFGYIGPYDRKKGFYMLVDVFKELRKKYSNFEVNFYGDIRNQSIFKESWAINHGIIPKEKMNKVYQNIDVLIQPSLWHETFGFTVLEALSQGIPCIVSKNVGAKDLLKMNSLIFSNEDNCFNEIKIILNNPQTINKLIFNNQSSYFFSFKEHANEIIKYIYKNN